MYRRGFSTTEMLFAIAIGAILLGISVPAFLETLERMRHRGAVRQAVSVVRDARAQAISKGWQYRVVGYDTDATGSRRNQYRILGRRSTAVDWPDEEATPFRSDTQQADRWIDLSSSHPGVELDADNARFELTFDSRGAAPGAPADFSPLRVRDKDGRQASISVSVIGGIKIE